MIMKSFKFMVATLIAVTTLTTSAIAVTSKPTPKVIMEQSELTQKNKALVLKAYQELFGDHDLKALDRYWATPYIQHNRR
jgi:hypothetical protein